MAILNRTVTDVLYISETVSPESTLLLDAYGSLERANIYFDNRLRALTWTQSSNKDKNSSLVEATRIIDSLSFKGQKYDPDQLKQFPRTYLDSCGEVVNTDTQSIVPSAIEFACYEIALKLIEGADPDLEVSNLSVTSRTYGGVKTTYDRGVIPDFLAAGVLSAKAWRLLQPYLLEQRSIKIERVS